MASLTTHLIGLFGYGFGQIAFNSTKLVNSGLVQSLFIIFVAGLDGFG